MNRSTIFAAALASALPLYAVTMLDAGDIRYSAAPGELAHVAVTIPETDFTPYDRFCLDVVNDGPNADEINIQLATDGEELVKSFYRYDRMRRRHWAEVGKSCWTVDLGLWPKKVKSRKVKLLHFFCVRPFGSSMRIGRLRLLKAGETDASTRYSDEEECRIAAIVVESKSKADAAHAKAMATLAAQCADAGLPTNRMIVSQATSMDQVRPLGIEGFSYLRPAKSLAVRLARDEYESIQVVVTPVGAPLKNVRVSVSGLESDCGTRFSSTNITCEVTGYTKTHGVAAYRVGRRAEPGAESMRKTVNPVPGWWADTILPHLHATDVEPGVLQGFWVRIKCPSDQAKGTYRGSLTVSADSADSIKVPFSIRVNGFAVPRSTPLPLAITFNPSPTKWAETAADALRIARDETDPETPWKLWKRHRVEWSDFLSDYYITIDNLYYNKRNLKRDFDMLARQRSRGRDGRINMNYWGGTSDKPRDKAKWEGEYIPMLKRFYDEAKQFGVADRVYLYGSDETPFEKCGSTAVAAKKLKTIFPTVPLMTTARDPDYGVGTILSDIDAFVPLTWLYNPEKAKKSRAEGHEVWWYIADSPTEKYANMQLEHAPLDARSLMGAQTAKFRPDGFLVWQISKWNSSRPISRGPFTDWDAKSYLAAFNGCGYWTACGPDGIPIPTIRLENFRDGLEDFAYVKLLEAKLKTVEEGELARNARALVAVPDAVCSAMDNFSSDPDVIYAWRDAMADLIESMP